jgi:small-conductance mechanosensitive channel
MNIMQINTAILQGSLTNNELTSIIDAVKFARARLTEQNKRSLSIGDNVHFNSTKLKGAGVTGVVVKIAIKFVTVKTVSGMWRVPANMLSKINEPEFA